MELMYPGSRSSGHFGNSPRATADRRHQHVQRLHHRPRRHHDILHGDRRRRVGDWFVPLLIGAPEVAAHPTTSPLLAVAPLRMSMFVEGSPGMHRLRRRLGSFIRRSYGRRAGPAMDRLVAASGRRFVEFSARSISSPPFCNMRAPGMTITAVLFVWSAVVTALSVLSLPVLGGRHHDAATDRNLAPLSSTRPAAAIRILFQHLFWFFGHPEDLHLELCRASASSARSSRPSRASRVSAVSAWSTRWWQSAHASSAAGRTICTARWACGHEHAAVSVFATMVIAVPTA